MSCEVCINEQRIQQLENDSKRNSEQHKEFYSSLEDSKVSGAVTNERYNTIIQTLNSLSAKVENMQSVPQKRWDTVIASVITGIIGAVIGILFL